MVIWAENIVWELVFVGALGGLARASYGMYKAIRRGRKINKGYFISTIILYAILGGIMGGILNVDYRIAAGIGYVGTDFMENILIGLLPKSIQINQD